ncbi:MAG: P-loop NTPase fold protein, partial [Burkholderiaceae bacterium]
MGTKKRKKSNKLKRKKKIRVINTEHKTTETSHKCNNIKQIYELMLQDFNELSFSSLPKSREGEYDDVVKKLQQAIKTQRGTVIYVYGKEGTGKTHLMKFLVSKMEENDTLLGTIPFIDCSTKQ